jgi:hypothetical protein
MLFDGKRVINVQLTNGTNEHGSFIRRYARSQYRNEETPIRHSVFVILYALLQLENGPRRGAEPGNSMNSLPPRRYQILRMYSRMATPSSSL